jgi:hypothetical protein
MILKYEEVDNEEVNLILDLLTLDYFDVVV